MSQSVLCRALTSEPRSWKSLLNCCLEVVTSKLHAAFLLVSYNELIKKSHKQYTIFKYLESALKTNDLIKSMFVSQGALKATQRCEKTQGLKWAGGERCMSTLTHGGSGVKCAVCFSPEIPLESEKSPLVNQNWHVTRQELISTAWHIFMDSCFVGNFMISCTSNPLACLAEVQEH